MFEAILAQMQLNEVLFEHEQEQKAVAREKASYELMVKHRAEMRRAFLNSIPINEHYAHMQKWVQEDMNETLERHAKLQAEAEARMKNREQRTKEREAREAAAKLEAEARAEAAKPHAQKLQEIADMRLKDVLGSLYDWVMKK